MAYPNLKDNIENNIKISQDRILSSPDLENAFRRPDPFRKDPLKNIFTNPNTSYSGTDTTIIAQINENLISMGNAATFSYSTFREKFPVRVLGRSRPKGYTAGGRTISGSIVFVVFDRHPLYDIVKHINYVKDPEDRYTSPSADQLPPIDLIIFFTNEYGHSSILRLYAVEFFSEGTVHSINDIYSEGTMQYYARDLDLMLNYDQIKNFRNALFERQIKGLFTDNQLSAMLEYRQQLERNINEINKYILEIDQELGKRLVGGVFTLGMWPLANNIVGRLGATTVRREDLQEQKEKYLKIKSNLINELDKVNRQIALYNQNIKGWNAQNAQAGIAQFDNRGAPVTP